METPVHGYSPVGAKVRLCAHDPQSGEEICVEGACCEIAERGFLVKVDEPIPLQSTVSFRIAGVQFQGWGTVHHCGAAGPEFFVGVEFSDGLRWP